MQMQTKYFGDIEVQQHQMIDFPQGIPGFLDEKEFVLLDFDESGLFQVLQSTNAIDPAFIVINPFLYVKDYEVDIDDNTLNSLEIQEQKQVEIRTIITVKDPLTASTANLQAPIIINSDNRLAKQYITNEKHYSTAEKIFQNTSTVKGE
ncbi:flagellar assembly protein FliW [Gracilibacillus salinarum]|uniref:Flagellar assembly factor FliW n=1 Tax=Gracilibacillus salinarum TaxID=2932255 RepID=A0ABY4GN62_9BACI|nr:flagellar assembly protein FliW [Gracilibacillus salinarum]UOQ85172.1 flagellar assembly protein FliW [Gracilibacillus salinarum]